ncbi:DUF2213 domain-containing protein [Dickeya poaceiphila]|uniref:DUF2213 domain-containing protein n=1 Tax=Dickeya poaceiphila TaxID=568768 RepID=A0A5B8I6C8_9GAMM|nr:DUF2213 domain-containing protein [Dickeya poaceiphila]QDX29548.1 DUF2213 domain-containing protein [Dickeya poaceiphila]
MPVHKKNGRWWFGSKGPFPTREKAEEAEKAAYANGYIGDRKIALDSEPSRRRIDENGYLHVSQTHLTKEQVAPYLGKEIPGWQELNLEPERVYYGYRSGEELEKARDTFNGMPLLREHRQDSADAPLKEFRIGSIGTTPVWSAPYLDNALIVTDSDAIEKINNGTLREISCGYFFEPDFTPGEFNGVNYDFVMRNLRGNHVALVEKGRAGPDVYVHDAMPSNLSQKKVIDTMKKLNRKGVALRSALAAHLKPLLAQDAAPGELTALVRANKTPVAIAKAAVQKFAPLLAQDIEIDPTELAEALEAAEQVVEPEEKQIGDGVEEEPQQEEESPAYDAESPAESIKQILEQASVPPETIDAVLKCLMVPANDENGSAGGAEGGQENQEKKDVVTQAVMDAAIKSATEKVAQAERERAKALTTAASKVEGLCGKVDAMAFDSAADIYAHALKAKGIDTSKFEPAGYAGMVEIMLQQKQSQPAPVGDSAFNKPAKLDGKFAGLANIRL